MSDPDRHEDHIWHTAAPRPNGEPTRGARVLGLAFVLLVAVAVVIVLVLILSGMVSTDPVGPDTP